MDIHYDGGEPRPARVVVGVSGSLDSFAALHRAATEARRRGAELLVVLAWQPPGGEFGYRRSPCPPLLSAVRDAALERLLGMLDEAFGATGPDVAARAELVRGEPADALTAFADRPDDLVVVAAGSANPLRRGLRPSVARQVVRRAGCPVLVVPRPALQRELERPGRRLRSRTLSADGCTAPTAVAAPEIRHLPSPPPAG